MISTMEAITYSVPGMHCGHCKDAVERELSAVEGVSSVDADLESKLVRVTGRGLSDGALREAIEEAGYEPA
jgi:copper chaperone